MFRCPPLARRGTGGVSGAASARSVRGRAAATPQPPRVPRRQWRSCLSNPLLWRRRILADGRLRSHLHALFPSLDQREKGLGPKKETGRRQMPSACEFVVGVTRFELVTSSVSGKWMSPSLACHFAKPQVDCLQLVRTVTHNRYISTHGHPQQPTFDTICYQLTCKVHLRTLAQYPTSKCFEAFESAFIAPLFVPPILF